LGEFLIIHDEESKQQEENRRELQKKTKAVRELETEVDRLYTLVESEKVKTLHYKNQGDTVQKMLLINESDNTEESLFIRLLEEKHGEICRLKQRLVE